VRLTCGVRLLATVSTIFIALLITGFIMERNSFVRLTAQKIERTDPEFDFKIVIICGLDAGKIIIDGEWMGYFRHKFSKSPFTYEPRSNEFNFHAIPPCKMKATLAEQQIVVGAKFSIFTALKNDWGNEQVFSIAAIHSYDGN